MAVTKETTKDKSTQPKKTATKVEQPKSNEVEELRKQLNTLMAQVNQQPQAVEQPKSNVANRNVKVTSLVGNDFVLKTSIDGQKRGKVFVFEHFGDTKLIRMNDMVDILSGFLKYFEDGYVIIDNKEDAIELDVEYIYDEILTCDKMKELLKLNSYDDVDKILNMNQEMQENIAGIIADNIANGTKYDMNIISTLEKRGLNILKTSEAVEGYLKDESESK